MLLTPKVCALLEDAQTQKALATVGSAGLNVVPVSTIRLSEGRIWLIDYFFAKTRTNLTESETATLVAWRGLDGFQVRAKVEYLTQGELFTEAVTWIASLHPTRTVRGLVILTPLEIHSVSIADKKSDPPVTCAELIVMKKYTCMMNHSM